MAALIKAANVKAGVTKHTPDQASKNSLLDMPRTQSTKMGQANRAV